MKGTIIIQEKSFEFAKLIVLEMHRFAAEKHEYVLSRQLIRSGTAIGALVAEAEHAQSKADFIHKLNIALKEANETRYWLRLLKETSIYVNDHLSALSEELVKILVAILKTLKAKY